MGRLNGGLLLTGKITTILVYIVSMEKPVEFGDIAELETQRSNVAAFYDHAAPEYVEALESKTEYQLPRIIREVYNKYGIKDGSVLDIGCGIGKIKDYLGPVFTYQGIDLSPGMVNEAKKNGFDAQLGPVEELIKSFGDKSVDHITAMTMLYFVKDWEGLAREFERVARKSIFVSLDQFESKLIQMMKTKGIDLYNHDASAIHDPTEVQKNVFIWKRAGTEDRVYGDIVFKKF